MGPTQSGQKVTIESTIDDQMAIFPLKGAGGKHLRRISLEICHQRSINEGYLERIDGFEFKKGYKHNIMLHIQKISFQRDYLEILRLILSRDNCCMSGPD